MDKILKITDLGTDDKLVIKVHTKDQIQLLNLLASYSWIDFEEVSYEVDDTNDYNEEI